jgi:hypothetical protein
MPAPTTYEYATSIIVAAQTLVLDAIDAGTGPGKIKLRDESDTLLAEIVLNDPCGTVDGAGLLTIDVTPAPEDASADASGTCSYAEFTDSDDNVVLTLPAQAGTTPVSGKVVLNTLSVVAGVPVTLISATIG